MAQLRWHEPEAQQVAIKIALMVVRSLRCAPASDVLQAEICAACANEQLCGVLLPKLQSDVTGSGSKAKLAQWAHAMEAVKLCGPRLTIDQG